MERFMLKDNAVRICSRWAASLMLMTTTVLQAQPTPPTESLRIDARAETRPFPHFWETTFGSGRAILSLRDSYRKDLHSVKEITAFQAVRFHAIFHDEVGLYDPDRKPIQFA